MRSIVAYTEEIDDLDAATEELFEQVRGFALGKHSMAVLYAEEDTDYPALYELLSKEWDFPIVGCTAMAMLSDKKGYCRSGISALILTADDCVFSAGITCELNKENYKEEIERLYKELEAQHPSEVKLALCYSGISLTDPILSGSNLMLALNEAANGLPIYGGAASDSFTFVGYKVFCDDRTTRNGIAVALISGGITPRFVRVNSVEHTASFLYKITKAEGNVVYRLGDGSFVDALKTENMRVDTDNVMSTYILSPFVVTVDKGENDRVEVARILSSIDRETGSGTFLGMMPEGATLGIGLLSREDVCRSVEEAFTRMFSELARERSGHTTLLCTSCSARYLALINDPSVEAKTYLGRMPSDVSLMGLYAYGECCPVRGKATGKSYNMFHNFTFTILAL